jgi:uncharacterized protein YrrD
MNASDLKGRAIVTLSDAAKVGQVDETLFDSQYRTVVGFRISTGVFHPNEAVLRSQVSAIGADAITLPNPSALNHEDRFPELQNAVTLGRVVGSKMVTPGGELIGTVSAVTVDDQAQNVVGYTLATSILDRMRHGKPQIGVGEVTSVGADGIMLITESAADAVRGVVGR